jgi:hypothetical protein
MDVASPRHPGIGTATTPVVDGNGFGAPFTGTITGGTLAAKPATPRPVRPRYVSRPATNDDCRGAGGPP